jgi:ABC-type transport system involved in cytochrome c biogenesis ATPase subunit
MPTFQSIPLHPAFQQKLQSGSVPIATPQALLSRTPQALVEQLLPSTSLSSSSSSSSCDATSMAAALTQVHLLRHQVAQAMIAQTRTGTKRRLLSSSSGSSSSTSCSNNNDHDHTKQQRRRGPLIPGATTSVLSEVRRPPPNCLSTGCRALDQLLQFPPEYQYTSSRTTMGEDHGSFPQGHVLTIEGPSSAGKTQLALQLGVQCCKNSTILHNNNNNNNNSGSRRAVRYLFSNAGQDGHALANRSRQLMQTTTSTTSMATHRRGTAAAAAVSSPNHQHLEFQGISTTTQLVRVLADLEASLLRLDEQDGDGATDSDSHATVPAMVIVDSLSCLVVEQDDEQVERLARWLKRLARLYRIWVVVVIHNSSSVSSSFGDVQWTCAPRNAFHNNNTKRNGAAAGVHVTLTKHVARVVEGERCDSESATTNNNGVSLIYTPFGLSTPTTTETETETETDGEA